MSNSTLPTLPPGHVICPTWCSPQAKHVTDFDVERQVFSVVHDSQPDRAATAADLTITRTDLIGLHSRVAGEVKLLYSTEEDSELNREGVRALIDALERAYANMPDIRPVGRES